MEITPEQIRAARAILKWNQSNLCERAGVPFSTVKSAERSEEIEAVQPALLDRIRRALEGEQIEFIPRGVRLRRPDAQERFERLQDISTRSAAKLAGRGDLLTDDDLYDENGLPA